MDTTLPISVLGTHVALHLPGDIPDQTQNEIAEQWARLRGDANTTSAHSITIALHRPDTSAPGSAAALPGFGRALTAAVADVLTRVGTTGLAGRALMLHAAAVATGDGRVIVLVGRTGEENSAAARALGRSRGYVSSTVTAITPDRAVIPLPGPVADRDGMLCSPAQAGMLSAPARLELAAIALLDKWDDPIAPQVATAWLPYALADLVPRTLWLTALPCPLHTIVDTARATGGIRRVLYTDAAQLPDLADRILVTATPHDASTTQALPSPPAAYGIRRKPYTDAVVFPEHVGILTGEIYRLLAGPGAATWRAADGVDPDDLHDRVRALMADPPPGIDTDTEITNTISQLIAAGLLTNTTP